MSPTCISHTVKPLSDLALSGIPDLHQTASGDNRKALDDSRPLKN